MRISPRPRSCSATWLRFRSDRTPPRTSCATSRFAKPGTLAHYASLTEGDLIFRNLAKERFARHTFRTSLPRLESRTCCRRRNSRRPAWKRQVACCSIRYADSACDCVLPTGQGRKTGEEGKSDTLQFVLHQGLHLVAPHVPRNTRRCAEAKPKSGGGKTTKTGGSDPTFSAFSRPKSAWGRSRPEAPYPVPAVFSTSSDRTFAIHFEGDSNAHH